MKRANSQLERAALRLYKLRDFTDDDTLDYLTCTCPLCRATRAFMRACTAHVAKAKGRK